MTITLSEQAAVHLQAALEKQAKEIAGAKLYTGTNAIKTFGLTRKSLTQISPTMLPGRTKPLYSATAIVAYIKSRTK